MKSRQQFLPRESVLRLCLVTVAFLVLTCNSANAGSVRLVWNPSAEANVAGYRFYRGEASGGPYALLNAIPVQGFTYSDDSAEPGRVYYYVVSAVDGSGRESAFSQELKVTPGRYDPAPPEGTVVIQAVPDLAAQAGEMVVLPGVGWIPEGEILICSWVQTLGPAVSIARSTALEAAFLAPLVAQDTWFAFALTVMSAQGATATETVRVKVQAR